MLQFFLNLGQLRTTSGQVNFLGYLSDGQVVFKSCSEHWWWFWVFSITFMGDLWLSVLCIICGLMQERRMFIVNALELFLFFFCTNLSKCILKKTGLVTNGPHFTSKWFCMLIVDGSTPFDLILLKYAIWHHYRELATKASEHSGDISLRIFSCNRWDPS